MKGRALTAPAEAPPALLRLFLSYSRRDSELRAALHASLEVKGTEVFFDERDIPGGAEWRAWIQAEVERADALVCLVTDAWLRSPYCRDELDIAIAAGKRVVTVTRGVPPELLPAALAERQCISLAEDQSLGDVAGLLKAAASTNFAWLRKHRQLLDLTMNWRDGQERDDALLPPEVQAAIEETIPKQGRVDPPITPLQQRFLDTSRAHHVRRRRRLWRWSATGVAAVLVAAAVAGLQAVRRAELDRLATARAMVARGEFLFDAGRSPQAALRLGIAAYQTEPLPEAEAFLRRLVAFMPELAETRALKLSPGSGRSAEWIDTWLTIDHDDRTVTALMVNRDGRITQLSANAADGPIQTKVLPLSDAGVLASAPYGQHLVVAQPRRPWARGTPGRISVVNLHGETSTWDLPLPPEAAKEQGLPLAIDPLGRVVAYAVGDRLTVYDLAARQARTMQLPEAGGYGISRLAVSPTGRWVAAQPASWQTGRAPVLMVDMDVKRSFVVTWMPEGVGRLAFSPDSELLALSTTEGNVRILAAPQWDETRRIAATVGGALRELRFSRDSEFLALVGRQIELHHLPTARRSALLDGGNTEDVVFDRSSRALWGLPRQAENANEVTLVRWQLDTGDEHRRMLLTRMDSHFATAAFSTDSKGLLLAGGDRVSTVVLDGFNLQRGPRLPNDRLVQDALGTPTGWQLAAQDRLYRLPATQRLSSTGPGWAPKRGQMSLSPDGAMLLWRNVHLESGQPPRETLSLATFDTATGQELSSRTIVLGQQQRVVGAWAGNNRIVVGLRDAEPPAQQLLVLDARRLEQVLITRKRTQAEGNILTMAWSHDGRVLAAATDRAVESLDPLRLSVIQSFARATGAFGSPEALALSSDGSQIALLDMDHRVEVSGWDGRPLARLRVQRYGYAGSQVRFSPDGQWLVATLGEDRGSGAAYLWRWQPGELLPAACRRVQSLDWGTTIDQLGSEAERLRSESCPK